MPRELGRAVGEAGAVFHLAAQVAVTTSLADPTEDFDINLHGTLLLLDALRRARRHCRSSSRAPTRSTATWPTWSCGATDDAYVPVDPSIRRHGIGEDRPLDFHTPYGCSKGAADQYVLDYARSFGMPTAVLRMSCIYGPRQMGTEDQGWVAHFLIRALQGKPISIYGDGRQVRDILLRRGRRQRLCARLARRSERIRGQRLQPRRRTCQCRQPAPGPACRSRRCSARRSQTAASATGGPAISATTSPIPRTGGSGRSACSRRGPGARVWPRLARLASQAVRSHAIRQP